MKRSSTLKEMVRVAKDLPVDSKVELRGLQWEIGRNKLTKFVTKIYNSNSKNFYSEAGKFIAARLVEVALEDISKESSKKFPVKGERAIKNIIRTLVDQKIIKK